MFSRPLCLYRRSLFLKNPINNLLITKCVYTTKENRHNLNVQTNVSKKFPGYKVIYMFPQVKYLGLLNRVKYYETLLFGATAPINISLHLLNFISYDEAYSFILGGCIFTMWLHMISIFCNNVVGFVYLKESDEEIVTSYVSYWGKRVDLNTTLSDVSFSSFMKGFGIYEYMHIRAPKKILKINMKPEYILENEYFDMIVFNSEK